MVRSEQKIRSAITELASEWYVAHRTGCLSEAKRAEFLAWVKASPLHIEEYLGIAALERVLPEATKWPRQSVAELADLAHADPSSGVVELHALPPVAARPAPWPGPRRRWRQFAAIGILCLAGIGVGWRLGEMSRVSFTETYSTAHGANGTWALPDGSTLRLDTDTTVTVWLSPRGRLLDLRRGQLWVKVAHDLHRPFRVLAGSTEVLAVGTEFDVYRLRQATLVSVMAGQVAVSDRDPSQRTVDVGAGEQIRIVNGIIPAAPTPTTRGDDIAWLGRKISFESRPLGEVADEFNRYNALPLTIDDPALRRLPISGTFAADDLDSFVAFLKSLEGVRVERSAQGLRVYTYKPPPPSRVH